jgi:undecaprenyl-diphosphatase
MWACGALARAYAGGVDLPAVRDLAALRSHAVTAGAHAASFIGGSYIVFPLALAISGVLFLRHFGVSAAIVTLSTFGAAIIENIDKVLVGRPRPPVRHLEFVTSASFPSGHATQSTALYGSLLFVALTRLPEKSRLLLVLPAVLLVSAICFSRVYLGVHYPTDVGAGVLLGASWTALVSRNLHHAPPDEPALAERAAGR